MPFMGNDRFSELSPLRHVPVLIDDRVTLADSRTGDVFIRGTARDLQGIDGIVRNAIPPVLDYLESQVPGAGFLFGTLGIADISIATFLRNAAFARYRIDPERWPVAAAYMDRVLAQECFTKLQPYEAVMMRTPIPGQRAALANAGAPLSAATVGGDVHRRGVLRT